MLRYIFILLSIFIITACGGNKTTRTGDTMLSPTESDDNMVSPIRIGGVFHKVKEGESLWAIANAYKVPLEDIIEINDFNPKSILHPNDEIFIPNVKNLINKPIVSQNTTQVESSNNFKYRKAKKSNKINFQKQKSYDLPQKYLNSMKWPVNGVIITEFGKYGKLKSDGMDIAAPLDTKIISVMDGSVIYSGSQSGYGNLIIIKHKNKIITIYAHNNKNLIKKGQKVKKGQIIATIGNTGNAQRYQLHFELRKGVKAINPAPYLEKD